MKKILRYTFVALLGAMAFTACTNEYEYDGVGEPENSNASGVYFAEKEYSKSIEVEPGAEAFDITLARSNDENEQTVGITVVSDEDNVFDVPSSATFAAGESTTTLHITAPNAEEGSEYSLTIAIDEAAQGIYTAGIQQYTVSMAVQKWEKLGTGYWLDGPMSYLFSLNSAIPYAVQVEQLTTATGYRFRFYGPYSHVVTGDDGIGYIGYPYNEEGDCDEEDHLFVIDVTSAGASLKPVAIGLNWGYGAVSFGTVVGNLSSNGQIITDTDTYPLGVYNKEAGVITFPASSLYIRMTDWGVGIATTPSYLYLSAEAYLASLEEEE